MSAARIRLLCSTSATPLCAPTLAAAGALERAIFGPVTASMAAATPLTIDKLRWAKRALEARDRRLRDRWAELAKFSAEELAELWRRPLPTSGNYFRDLYLNAGEPWGCPS